MIRRFLVVGAVGLFLAACGTGTQDRALGGAGVGALGGALVGAPLLGAGVGAATGALTDADDVDLGEPVWR